MSKEITLEISDKLWKALEEQVAMTISSGMIGSDIVFDVPSLVVFYLEQFSSTDGKMGEIQDRLNSVFEILKDKGVDIEDLFSFAGKVKKDVDLDDDIDFTNKKVKKS